MQKKLYIIVLTTILIVFLSAFNYNLTRIEEIHILPDILLEVSGITIIDTNKIACVQDEKGIIFIYDMKKKQITNEYTFSVDGDYEGIAFNKNDVYILRSDGVIFELRNYDSRSKVINEYKTNIDAKNNEGLCYDKVNNRLLIASKSKSRSADKYYRFVHVFDLNKRKLSEEPILKIDFLKLENFLKENNIKINTLKKTKKKFTKNLIKFRPSAIAIHPISHEFYILSSADNLLLVYDKKMKIKHAELLDKTIFNKAEGITFSLSGDMYISNEGGDGKPTLLKFNYLK